MLLQLFGSLLCFHMNFRIAFSVYIKNISGILLGIALNIYFSEMESRSVFAPAYE